MGQFVACLTRNVLPFFQLMVSLICGVPNPRRPSVHLSGRHVKARYASGRILFSARSVFWARRENCSARPKREREAVRVNRLSGDWFEENIYYNTVTKIPRYQVLGNTEVSTGHHRGLCVYAFSLFDLIRESTLPTSYLPFDIFHLSTTSTY